MRQIEIYSPYAPWEYEQDKIEINLIFKHFEKCARVPVGKTADWLDEQISRMYKHRSVDTIQRYMHDIDMCGMCRIVSGTDKLSSNDFVYLK